MNDVYTLIEPSKPLVPIILSVPHCGVGFPNELKDQFVADKMAAPDDTDWYVQDLYNFVSDMGITIIHANYSRWVTDLNRDPESKALYDDGRIITALTPTTDFFGDNIYLDERFHPNTTEVDRRLDAYYWPYYKQLEKLLLERKEQFGKVLLLDAHSIRHFVPTIRKEIFPDMILGNNDGKSADATLIETTLNTLRSGSYQINHNEPFKGGHITRYFGKPGENVHALQLEMNKILYMDDTEKEFAPERANKVRELLRPVFENLIEKLS
jgi:N-formylglutamate deformylase